MITNNYFILSYPIDNNGIPLYPLDDVKNIFESVHERVPGANIVCMPNDMKFFNTNELSEERLSYYRDFFGNALKEKQKNNDI